MNTKGQEAINTVLNVFIQLVVVLLVFFGIFTYVQDTYTDDTFERTYIAKDIALALEAIQTGQGNSVLLYEKDTNSYTFNFAKDFMQIYNAVDNPNPSPYFRTTASYSVDRNFKFSNLTLDYMGIEIHPTLVKTNNKLNVFESTADYNLKLYSYKDVNTTGESKNYVFGTDSDDDRFEDYVRILVGQLGYQFTFSTAASANFIISKSSEDNIIFAPATKEKRKLASIIANKLIEQEEDCVILPSKNNIFTIKIKEGNEAKLTSILKKSFEEYYD